jgi:hypothetical protein
MSNKRLAMAVATIAAMALSAPAAAFVTYFVGGDSSCTMASGVRTCDGVVKIGAHAFTGPDAATDTTVQSAILGVYSGGLGVTYQGSDPKESTSSPQHALDNDGKFEFIRVDFGMAVTLSAVLTGWVQNDADITVLSHTGAGSPDPNGKTIAQLTTAGWSLVGHFNGTSADSQTINVNATDAQASQYWLIGAFDPLFGGDANGANWGSGKYDYLKVFAVKWDKPSKAAEPATLLLFMAGLLAWLSSRRRTARI